MPKETEFFNAASVVDSSPIKTAETRGRSGSTSSARYRVSSRPTNVLVPSSTDASDPSSRSTEPRLSALLKRMSKNSASTETSGEPKNARFTLTTDAVPPPKGSGATVGTPKLPQKLRQHVSRLRNQFALGSNSASTRTLSLGDRAGKAPRLSISSASINSKRFSIATAAAIQHSRRSNQFQQLQVPKEDEKPAELVAEVFKRLQEPELTAANPGTFHDLLRPLQSSLSCAFLNTGWSSDEEDEAEQLFRQSERENSRMLRVCCSIDNLMLSIGDQAQEQKQPEAIIRGATRDLVKLFQFALKQVISVIFDKTDNQTSSNNSNSKNELSGGVGGKVDGKEAQYAKELLLEINERVGKLYEFARCVFVNEVDGLRQRITELEEGLAAAVLKNEQLQTEMRDLRDFYEQNNANSVDSFTASSSDSRRPVLDSHSEDPAISALSLPEIPGVNSEAGDDEGNALKQQCHELSRLLELAKQEIRLSHHERDVHKAHVAEVSSALFHDSELGMLRNQLQSEKKRVRVLERENLTLREEQVTKLQSLEALQAASLGSPATADSPSVGRQIRPSIDAASSTVVAQQQSVELRRDSPVESTLPMSEVTIDTQENQYNFTNSGDERKIPADVFLALLMETYKFQLQWERDQLRALFIHLNHQEEVQQRASEKLAKAEAVNDKVERPKAGEGDKKRPKMKLKRGKSRDRTTEANGGSKYLRGLSRNVLRELLLQSGIVQDSDVAQMDMDWLFAVLLKGAGGVAADITFDGLSVVEASFRPDSESTAEVSLDQEVGVGKTQFSELLVLIAIERHRVALAHKREKAQLTTTKRPQDDNKEALLEAEELAGRPGRIMAQFCRKILAPRAFASENPLVERNFAAKLSCPLVGRALLEHRSFLRTIFFFYAKQDEVAADERAALEEQALIRELQENGGRNARAEDPESSATDVSAALLQPHPGADFHLEKTKRSSMSFGEFQTFLTAFDLLGNKVALADAQQVFSSVMALDNDDTLQLEFDEFAAAIVALAVHLDPSPFSLWHQKLDRFAAKLHRVWDTQNEGVTLD
ncbi:hypothetical protein JG688_00008601 [Phytophthora aleatoria]|uniref:Uncharacterized protein n=1 Tax=Phytophthora aleatoria TaxID=2496075 RepID=A0A8J5J6V6_9STRA|nr:hypothetical protein JG688_00008601 [Phytophthora aleatoria]